MKCDYDRFTIVAHTVQYVFYFFWLFFKLSENYFTEVGNGLRMKAVIL